MSTSKNLPNIPIYVGDWMKDCSGLSLEAEGAWLRIIFKMWTNGKQSVIKLRAKALQNMWRCSADQVDELFEELQELDIGNLRKIKQLDKEYYEFECRRFTRENKISAVRSAAGSSKSKSKDKQNKNKSTIKREQIPDIDIDNDIDFENENEIGGLGDFEIRERYWSQLVDAQAKDIEAVMMRQHARGFSKSQLADILQKFKASLIATNDTSTKPSDLGPKFNKYCQNIDPETYEQDKRRRRQSRKSKYSPSEQAKTVNPESVIAAVMATTQTS